MQRMGGGKQKGGGNDPSCGCDMQAGWPSASELPRGGLQGGGNWNFNEFNLALTKNGKTRHLKGKWNKNNNGMRPSMNTNNSNMNNHSNNGNNMNNKNKNKTKTKTRKTNNKNKNNKANNKTTNRPMTSPPPPLENLMYEGKVYQTNRSTGDTYENGEYVGKYVRPNSGRPYLETSGPSTPNYVPTTPKTPQTPNYAPPNSPPPRENNYENTNEGSSEEYDTEEVNSSKPGKTLSMNGGSMPVCGSCPFPGTGACDFYAKGGKRNRKQRGGGCGCSAGLLKGGYRPTRKNLNALKKWRKGQSIGFTMTASLKAKGLIPRTSRKQKGKKVVSRKYR